MLMRFMPSGKSKKREQCKNTQMYPLSETQYCPCNKYNAQPVGNWSDCILPEGGRVEGLLGMKVQGDIKECGQGYRFQAMVCYDQDNRLVETSRCNSHGGLTSMWNKAKCTMHVWSVNVYSNPPLTPKGLMYASHPLMVRTKSMCYIWRNAQHCS